MLSLEQQCVSLELAKRLKELNVKQESLFYWHYTPYNDGDGYFDDDWEIKLKDQCYGTNKIITAYTASELLNELDYEINSYKLIIEKGHSIYLVKYSDYIYEDERVFAQFTDENICNALAKMLIFLIEQGIVKT